MRKKQAEGPHKAYWPCAGRRPARSVTVSPLSPKTPQFIFAHGVTTYIGLFNGHPNS